MEKTAFISNVELAYNIYGNKHLRFSGLLSYTDLLKQNYSGPFRFDQERNPSQIFVELRHQTPLKLNTGTCYEIKKLILDCVFAEINKAVIPALIKEGMLSLSNANKKYNLVFSAGTKQVLYKEADLIASIDCWSPSKQMSVGS